MRQIVFSSGLKPTSIFVILLSKDGFKSDCPETKFQTITSSGKTEKVTVQSSIAKLRIVTSNQRIKYQLPQFNQIKEHKHYYTSMENYVLSY